MRNWLLLVLFSSGEGHTGCDAGEGAFDVIFLDVLQYVECVVGGEEARDGRK